MCAAFSDMSDREVEIIAEALKGTTWLALFSRVSKTCRSAAVRAANDEASLRRLRVSDVVCSVELVKWSIDQGCPRQKNWDVCANAARAGYLETLKWLRANGFEWNVGTCASAARGGHLDVLKWLRANGCPWDEATCTSAARGGHLDVLDWARANGCPWNCKTCSSAAKGGHAPRRPQVGKGQAMAASGIRKRVPLQPREDIWTSLSGPGPTNASETGARVSLQPREATWASSSGPGPTNALGIGAHALLQPVQATWKSSCLDVGKGQWLLLERGHVFQCSQGRPPGRPQVGKGQCLRVE